MTEVPTPRSERPLRPAGRWCEAGRHTAARNSTASERGFMLPGTARWCNVDQRWECRTHALAHMGFRLGGASRLGGITGD